MKMYFCGNGAFDIFSHLPQGTNSYKLERTSSGHIVLPVCQYGPRGHSDPTQISLLSVPPAAVEDPWAARRHTPWYRPLQPSAYPAPSTPRFMRDPSSDSSCAHSAPSDADHGIGDFWANMDNEARSRYGRVWVRCHVNWRTAFFVPDWDANRNGEMEGMPNWDDWRTMGPWRRTILNYANGGSEVMVDNYWSNPDPGANAHRVWRGATMFFQSHDRAVAGPPEARGAHMPDSHAALVAWANRDFTSGASSSTTPVIPVRPSPQEGRW